MRSSRRKNMQNAIVCRFLGQCQANALKNENKYLELNYSQ